MKRLAQLLIPAVISIFSIMAGAAPAAAAEETKEKGTMIATQTISRGFVPLMERSAPARTQTATFALG